MKKNNNIKMNIVLEVNNRLIKKNKKKRVNEDFNLLGI